MQALRDAHAEESSDIVLLLGLLQQMGLPTLLDEHLKRYQREARLSLGWTISIWLTYIVSQGDHRKLTVRDWVRGLQNTLTLTTGQRIDPLDFTDDRLTLALHHLSDGQRWQRIEEDIAKQVIQVYDLSPQTVRADATTVSGHHEGGKQSLWQFGHSKDDPTLRQVKVMMSSLDPLGLPLATEVVPGNRADDPLYVPILERTFQALKRKKGLLVVGDCKMSARDTRLFIQQSGHQYLMPLPHTGETAKELPTWVANFWARPQSERILVYDELDAACADRQPIAQGYEIKREVECGGVVWQERVLVVQSFAHAAAGRKDLEQRLTNATLALFALTPPVGRGRRQIHKEEQLHQRAEAILKKYEVTGLLTYQFERQSQMAEKLVGRGRKGPNRQPQLVEVDVRYQITAVSRVPEAIAAAQAQLGWRAYVTNAPSTCLSLERAVLAYRNEFLVERIFARFKGNRLAIAPMFVKRDDQVKGLINLLSLAVRLLTLLEFVVRRTLQARERALTGLFVDSPNHSTKTPTAERLLQAFRPIKLITVYLADQTVWLLQGFSSLHQEIINLLGLPADLYQKMAKTIIHAEQATCRAA